MAESKMPWVKLYTEMLDEVKLARLSDPQKWRFVQLILLAGECDAAGALVTGDTPMTTADVSWRLRCDEKTLERDIDKLIEIGLVEMDDDTFVVAKFAERQGPTQETKRKQWRERQQRRRERAKRKNVTQESPVTPEDVTPLDKEEDKEEEEEEEEEIPAAAAFVPNKVQTPEYFSRMDVLPVLAASCGFTAFPGGKDNEGREEQILCLLEAHGREKTIEALRGAFKKWKSTPRKDGKGTYKVTNLSWVDWAQEILMGNGSAIDGPTDPTKMTQEEYSAWIRSRAEKQGHDLTSP